jgi:hypothetical protein
MAMKVAGLAALVRIWVQETVVHWPLFQIFDYCIKLEDEVCPIRLCHRSYDWCRVDLLYMGDEMGFRSLSFRCGSLHALCLCLGRLNMYVPYLYWHRCIAQSMIKIPLDTIPHSTWVQMDSILHALNSSYVSAYSSTKFLPVSIPSIAMWRIYAFSILIHDPKGLT